VAFSASASSFAALLFASLTARIFSHGSDQGGHS
jgi:hypothetical protein